MQIFRAYRFNWILLLMAAGAAMPTFSAQPVASYFPEKGLGQFLATKFDLASIRSSFGPRRTPSTRTFADFGMVPTKVGEDVLEFDDPSWFYGIQVLRRGDINGDGIEDLELCFVDKAKEGTYDARKPLLVTRYSTTTYAVALDYDVYGCEKSAR